MLQLVGEIQGETGYLHIIPQLLITKGPTLRWRSSPEPSDRNEPRDEKQCRDVPLA